MKKLIAVLVILVASVSFSYATHGTPATAHASISAFINDVDLNISITDAAFNVGCLDQGETRGSLSGLSAFDNCKENLDISETINFTGGNGWIVNVAITTPGITASTALTAITYTTTPTSLSAITLSSTGTGSFLFTITSATANSQAAYGEVTVTDAIQFTVAYN